MDLEFCSQHVDPTPVWIKCKVSIPVAEQLLNTKYYLFHHLDGTTVSQHDDQTPLGASEAFCGVDRITEDESVTYVLTLLFFHIDESCRSVSHLSSVARLSLAPMSCLVA